MSYKSVDDLRVRVLTCTFGVEASRQGWCVKNRRTGQRLGWYAEKRQAIAAAMKRNLDPRFA